MCAGFLATPHRPCRGGVADPDLGRVRTADGQNHRGRTGCGDEVSKIRCPRGVSLVRVRGPPLTTAGQWPKFEQAWMKATAEVDKFAVIWHMASVLARKKYRVLPD